MASDPGMKKLFEFYFSIRETLGSKFGKLVDNL
jgi:hypothetical protein